MSCSAIDELLQQGSHTKMSPHEHSLTHYNHEHEDARCTGLGFMCRCLHLTKGHSCLLSWSLFPDPYFFFQAFRDPCHFCVKKRASRNAIHAREWTEYFHLRTQSNSTISTHKGWSIPFNLCILILFQSLFIHQYSAWSCLNFMSRSLSRPIFQLGKKA